MTKEEYRNYVYSKYRGNGYVITKKDVEPYSISGGGFLSPDTCYEMINEKREINYRNRYSRHNQYYKINW